MRDKEDTRDKKEGQERGIGKRDKEDKREKQDKLKWEKYAKKNNHSALHSLRFVVRTTSSLSVREARRLASIEEEGDQWGDRTGVHCLVSLVSVEGVVEGEGLGLDHLCEIHLLIERDTLWGKLWGHFTGTH